MIAQKAKPPPWGAWRRRLAIRTRWGTGDGRVRMVNAAHAPRFRETTFLPTKIKLASLAGTRPVPTQEGVSSGHFAGKQTGPSASKTTMNGNCSYCYLKQKRPPPMTGKRGPFHFPPLWSGERKQKAGQRFGCRRCNKRRARALVKTGNRKDEWIPTRPRAGR